MLCLQDCAHVCICIYFEYKVFMYLVPLHLSSPVMQMILDLIIFFGLLVVDVVSTVGFVMGKQEGKPPNIHINVQLTFQFFFFLFGFVQL